jgi:drug/metabolite transporter (DMT)-like permease
VSGAPTRGDWLRVAALALLWGTAFALIEIGIADMAPGFLMMSRLWVSAIVLTLWSLALGQPLPRLWPPDRRWLWLGALGLLSAAYPFTAIAIGQRHVTSALAGILIASVPVMTAALAQLFVRAEPMTPRRILGLAAGFAGVVLLIGPAALADLGGPAMWAQLVILSAALAYAATSIIAYRLPTTPPYAASAGMMIVAALLATPLGLWDAAHDPTTSWPSLAAALGLGLGSSGIATILYLQLVWSAGPTFTVLTNYLAPVVAVIAGVALGETLEPRVLAAFAVIVLGVHLAVRRKSDAAPGLTRRPPPPR